ncbi:MAG: hypothetical protein JNK07_12760 [Alphaproteobacteria bacterium]|nr:hypothetical protein [Alphaproteobacteria bacterium]
MRAGKDSRPAARMLTYAPLAVHVISTLVVGFGFVLPGSPIEGLNVYTLGFLSAVLGFVPIYIAGISLAHRQERERKC